MMVVEWYNLRLLNEINYMTEFHQRHYQGERRILQQVESSSP